MLADGSNVEDIKEYDEQLRKLLQRVENDIARLSGFTGAARRDKIAAVSGLIEQCNLQYRSFRLELNELSKEEKRIYEAKLKDHRERIDGYINDLKWAKAEAPDGKSKFAHCLLVHFQFTHALS
eukprot:TRINITY_DN843_c0_g3_i1.p1 TRINITY_DN843_c0_g3~~TRINITY_DN843_c0_g3_i1.p1  ORF type:complete len:124 (+),score=23.40 TRINITY_DN843_c0_g3_i1:59-430(+)